MKRLGIFVFYDAQGRVDRYVGCLLKEMTAFLERLIIVCNGCLKERDQLEPFTDEIYVRENVGFDAAAWQYVFLNVLSKDEPAAYDEIILFNDTFFGPVYPLSEVFQKMDCRCCDFWGLTAHSKSIDPMGTCPYGYWPEHVQMYFWGVRKSMSASSDFYEYWKNLPVFQTFDEIVGGHETVFTKHFADLGYTWDVYLDMREIDQREYVQATHYADDQYQLLADHRFLFYKRKNVVISKNHYLEYHDASCIRRSLEFIDRQTDYDINMVLENILRIYDISELKEGLGLYEIMPVSDEDSENADKQGRQVSGTGNKNAGKQGGQVSGTGNKNAGEQSRQVSGTGNKNAGKQGGQVSGTSSKNAGRNTSAVIVVYIKNTKKIKTYLRYLNRLLHKIDLILLTDESIAEEYRRDMPEGIDCHVVWRTVQQPANELTAFFIDAQDNIMIKKYKYICFMHDHIEVPHFSYYLNGVSYEENLWESLAAGGESADYVIRRFEQEPFLGLILAPVPFHGNYFYTLHDPWNGSFEKVKELADLWGIQKDLSIEKEPLLSGNMFWCRQDALRQVFAHFPSREEVLQQDFISAMERIYPYLAQENGYYTAELMTRRQAAVTISNLRHLLKFSIHKYKQIHHEIGMDWTSYMMADLDEQKNKMEKWESELKQQEIKLRQKEDELKVREAEISEWGIKKAAGLLRKCILKKCAGVMKRR